jgi:hypothetical protein
VATDLYAILDESLVELPAAEATGKWEIIQYTSQADISEERCQRPNCYIKEDSTCRQGIQVDEITWSDPKAREQDEVPYALGRDDPILEVEEAADQDQEEGVQIHVQFLHQCKDVDPSAVGIIDQKCQVWETTLLLTGLAESERVCTAMVAGDEYYGEGEDKTITSPTDTEHTTIEALWEACQGQETESEQEIECKFSATVTFKNGTLELVRKSEDHREYLQWLENPQQTTIHIQRDGKVATPTPEG